MSDYTIRDFSAGLKEVAKSLDAIADDLKSCDQKVELNEGGDWKRILCGIPVVNAPETCAAPGPRPDSFSVGDLLETVEALRDWTNDIRSKVRRFAPDTRIDSGDWSQSKGPSD